MQVEVSKTDNYYQIRIPIKDTYHDKTIRRFLDYMKIKNNATLSQASDQDIQELSDEIVGDWWNNNKDSFLK